MAALELSVLNAKKNEKKTPESKWWSDEALHEAKDLLWNFYEIKEVEEFEGTKYVKKEKVVFNMDVIEEYLEELYKRLSAKWAPWYKEMSNEKIFWATVLAIQIALESIWRPVPQIWKYDIWVISGKLDEQTRKVIEEFQSAHKWLTVDGKPWKATIKAILDELKNPIAVPVSPIPNERINIPKVEELGAPALKRAFEWYTMWENLTWSQKELIKNRLESQFKSPVTVEMVQDSCKATWVPVEYLLAFMQNDSQFWTSGRRSINNHNPWNVWNYDNWRNKYYASWSDWVLWCAQNIKERIDKYMEKKQKNPWKFWAFPTVRELATWKSNWWVKFHGIYMSSTYGQNLVVSIANTWKKRLWWVR